ncbi:hypothetical protein EYF80_026029 [Liparis tanakae]|uniref:Uncharacterized protein n=1 Tax=Liparis tanakae TaxID=230148 RepID=A0A4Z2HFX2_9TELE|nr:hypothetical protein EYF80_026029 [Liparis tanakae]
MPVLIICYVLTKESHQRALFPFIGQSSTKAGASLVFTLLLANVHRLQHLLSQHGSRKQNSGPGLGAHGPVRLRDFSNSDRDFH